WGIGRADPRGRAREQAGRPVHRRRIHPTAPEGLRRLPCHRRPRIRRHHRAHPRGRGSTADGLEYPRRPRLGGPRDPQRGLAVTEPGVANHPGRADHPVPPAPRPHHHPDLRNHRHPARHPPPGAAELPAGILDHEPDPAQGAPPVLPGSPDVPHLGFCQYPAGARAPLDDGDAAQVPPRRAVQLIEANRPYAIAIVPTMLRRLLEAVPEGMDPGTKVIAASGEPIPPQIVEKTFEKFGPALYNLYGSTEVSWATIANPDDLQRHPNTAGKPPMATVVKVLDEDFRECPDGVVGRIYVANNMMFEGYTRPGKDKETHEGMIATGDLGYWEDGLLFVSGRSDDMVVSGGENVYPTDTEHIIGTLPEILEVCVQGVPDDEFGQALCA